MLFRSFMSSTNLRRIHTIAQLVGQSIAYEVLFIPISITVVGGDIEDSVIVIGRPFDWCPSDIKYPSVLVIPSDTPLGSMSWAKAITSRAAVRASPKPGGNVAAGTSGCGATDAPPITDAPGNPEISPSFKCGLNTNKSSRLVTTGRICRVLWLRFTWLGLG